MATRYVDPEIDKLIAYFTGASPDQFNEADTLAAEASLFGGFNAPRRAQYRQSEINQRYAQAVPLIQLRQQAALAAQAEAADAARQIRENNAAMERLQLQLRHADSTQSRAIAAQMQELQANNQAAMARLQLSEQGALTRQTQGDVAALARQAQGDASALARAQLSEQGAASRQATGIAAELAQLNQSQEFARRQNEYNTAQENARLAQRFQQQQQLNQQQYQQQTSLEDLAQRYRVQNSNATGQALNQAYSAYRNPYAWTGGAQSSSGGGGGFNMTIPGTGYTGGSYSSPSFNYSQSSWLGNSTTPNFYSGANYSPAQSQTPFMVQGTGEGAIGAYQVPGYFDAGQQRSQIPNTSDEWINQYLLA